MPRIRELAVVLIWQCFNCRREFETEREAIDCCSFTRKFYRCLGCGSEFPVKGRHERCDEATAHGLELMLKGFCPPIT